MLSAPQGGPEAPYAGDFFAAIETRAWDRLELMFDDDLVVAVHAAPDVHARRNEHLWRARTMKGRDELHDYLMDLNQAVPALAPLPRATSHKDGHAVIRTDCVGVDGSGSPFDAVADFSIWEKEGLINRVDIEVSSLTVGADVIRQAEGDPRRYFRGFLKGGVAQN